MQLRGWKNYVLACIKYTFILWCNHGKDGMTFVLHSWSRLLNEEWREWNRSPLWMTLSLFFFFSFSAFFISLFSSLPSFFSLRLLLPSFFISFNFIFLSFFLERFFLFPLLFSLIVVPREELLSISYFVSSFLSFSLSLFLSIFSQDQWRTFPFLQKPASWYLFNDDGFRMKQNRFIWRFIFDKQKFFPG